MSYRGMKRRKLKCILLSERGQSEKAMYCVIPTIWHSRKGKTMEGDSPNTSGIYGGKEEWRESTEDF